MLALEEPGSVGRIPDGELAIRDDNGGRVRPGRVGQVMLRGPSVMPGYLLDDIEGQPTGLQDGWLATGDLGSVDERGRLTIVGRTKEIINRGGEKIAPYDVEKALLAHPGVREAAAFAVPHARLGENVGAAVVLHPGAAVTSTDLIDFVYERLAPFQRPRHVNIVDSLPVGPTGKISRPRLSAVFADARRDTPRPAAPLLEILIAEIWQRLLKRADIGMDDDFFEIGGDSLQATEMLLEVEEATHHRINPSDIRAQLTIRVLCDRLAGAAGARDRGDDQGAGRGKAHRYSSATAISAAGVSMVFAERDPSRAGGLCICCTRCSMAPRASRRSKTWHRGYLAGVQAAAPAGPIRVAGYCHGGLAAASSWYVGSRRREGRSRRSS